MPNICLPSPLLTTLEPSFIQAISIASFSWISECFFFLCLSLSGQRADSVLVATSGCLVSMIHRYSPKSSLLVCVVTYISCLSQATEPPEGISHLKYADHPGKTKDYGRIHLISTWHTLVIRLAACILGNLDVRHGGAGHKLAWSDGGGRERPLSFGASLN